VVCEEHGIGGSGENIGNDAHLDHINVFYQEALGGKYEPRAVLFDLEPGVIGTVTPRRRSAVSSARAATWAIRAGKTWAKGLYKKVNHQFF
jgi:tubulin beta